MTMSDALTGTPGAIDPFTPPPGSEGESASVDPVATVPAAPVSTSPAPSVPPVPGRDDLGRSMDALSDVEMSVTVELGRTRLPVRHLLSLSPGSVIELNRSANTPVDILVNDTLFARGEVVVIDDEFGVRITELVRRDGPARS